MKDGDTATFEFDDPRGLMLFLNQFGGVIDNSEFDNQRVTLSVTKGTDGEGNQAYDFNFSVKDAL